MNEIIFYIMCSIGSYLLGSINTTLILGKLVFKKNVREYGSGNPGATNAVRAFGNLGGALAFAGDILKSVVAFVLTKFFATYLGYDFAKLDPAILVAFFVVLGHVFPIYYKFKGGKGVASAATLMFLLDWRVGLVALAIGLTVLIITRYISLTSLVGATVYPFANWFFNAGNIQLMVYTIIIVLLLFYKHRTNIERLIKGNEDKFRVRRNEQ